MFEINSKIQVLDRTNVWRNAIIVKNSNEIYTVRLENLSNKIETDYTKDMIRERVEERSMPLHSLSVRLNELANLIAKDKIFYKHNGDTRRGTVLQNDPFMGRINIEESHNDIFYEQISFTCINDESKKRTHTPDQTLISNSNSKRPKRIDQIFGNEHLTENTKKSEDESEPRLNKNREHERLISTIKDGFKTVNNTLNTLTTSLSTLTNTIEKIYQQQLNQQLALQQQNLQLIQYQQELREFFVNQTQLNNQPRPEHLQNLNLVNYETNSVHSNDEFQYSDSDDEKYDCNLSQEWSKEDDECDIEYCSKNIIRDLASRYRYGHLFAAQLMEKIFKPEEFEGCNVYGKGEKHMNKKPLDSKRVRYIQKVAGEIYNSKPPKDLKFWSKCVVHMNRRIITINKQHGKV